MFWEMLNAAKDLGRVQDIASVMIRYGFGGFVHSLGIGNVLERAGKALHWHQTIQFAQLETPQRIRKALEDLGPTFIKLGQILATRVDLFSPAYIAEFEKLQDQVSPLPFEDLLPQIEEDLGGNINEYFSYVDREPIAAASIAQVHRATLKDGTKVILKIRRPGLRKIIEADLRLLKRIAEIVESELPELHRFHPREVVRQLIQSLHRELDLAGECKNAERIATNLSDDPHIIIPKVYWQWTGERMNIQDYIEGIHGRDIDALEKLGLDRELLAERGCKAVMKMIMEDGFFHADPHPGNVFYLPNSKMAFIDFGMVGSLTSERREQVVSLLYGMIHHVPAKVAEILEDWSDNVETNQDALIYDIEAFVDQYSALSLKNLSLTAMLSDLMTILRDHQLTLPPDLVLLIKAYITLDGLGRFLNPDFNTLVFAAPFIQRIMFDRFRPEAIAKRGWINLINLADLLSNLPKDIRKFLRASKKGAIQIELSIRHIDYYIDKMDNAISRLSISLLTASLIIGSSIIMTVRGGPELFGFPVIGLFGFTFATFGGLWLLLSIRKSHGKH
jgi:ubiquinone biosynthesis protein